MSYFSLSKKKWLADLIQLLSALFFLHFINRNMPIYGRALTKHLFLNAIVDNLKVPIFVELRELNQIKIKINELIPEFCTQIPLIEV